MALPNTYSRRKREKAGADPDVYSYDVIPTKLRKQVFYELEDIAKLIGRVFSSEDEVWSFLAKQERREEGVQQLVDSYSATDKDELEKWFLYKAETDRCLDVIDVLHRIGAVQASRYSDLKEPIHDAIGRINARFQEAAVGYQLEAGFLVQVSSKYAHAEVVVPALNILHAGKFSAANEEFRKAHREFREGDHRDCITDCGKALESVLKVIAAERSWQGVGNNSQLAPLIKAAADNGLFATYMPEQLNGIKAMVQGAGTVRNKDGAHGVGTMESRADKDLAAYQLHQTAAAIIFIADRDAATAD